MSKAGLSDAIFPNLLVFTALAEAATAMINTLSAMVLLNMPDIFLPPFQNICDPTRLVKPHKPMLNQNRQLVKKFFTVFTQNFLSYASEDRNSLPAWMNLQVRGAKKILLDEFAGKGKLSERFSEFSLYIVYK